MDSITTKRGLTSTTRSLNYFELTNDIVCPTTTYAMNTSVHSLCTSKERDNHGRQGCDQFLYNSLFFVRHSVVKKKILTIILKFENDILKHHMVYVFVFVNDMLTYGDNHTHRNYLDMHGKYLYLISFNLMKNELKIYVNY